MGMAELVSSAVQGKHLEVGAMLASPFVVAYEDYSTKGLSGVGNAVLDQGTTGAMAIVTEAVLTGGLAATIRLNSAPTPKPAPAIAGLETRGVSPLPGTRQVPAGVPDGWRIRPTETKGGVWYYDPSNKGNAVRVMQGNPNSPFPNSQSPYVRWQKNGQALDANGNAVPRNTPNAHIPLKDFKFNPELFR
jgi:hypothetical protein